MEAVNLSRAARKLVGHWGEMGARWGITRTVAQAHALLYLAPRPLHAGELAELLGVARSNVSTSLRELQAWGLVRVTHILGDRREYFETIADMWQFFRTILEARWRREIQPTLAMVDACLAEAKGSGGDDHTRRRLEELRSFLGSLETLFDQLQSLEPAQIRRAVKMSGQVTKLLRLRS